MKMELPIQVEEIINKLEEAGYEAYAVGGCVRDTLLGRMPKDWDITTSAKPQVVKALFAHTIDTGIEHGTVTVMLDHIGFEVTTYRIDGEYEDARHPKEVIFTSSLAEDLRRRDFTINAMAYSHKAGLVDLFEGEADLKNHVIRCVGEAKERFSEDALRMLRAIRFSAQLGFTIEPSTCDAIRELAATIEKISAERIATELLKTITSDHPDYLKKAYELGLTHYFLPEFDRMMQMQQKSKHHIYTVGEHSLVAMQQIKSHKDLRLAMLLHDVAKPECMTIDEDGQMHFYGHAAQGVDLTKKVLRRLKLDNATIANVCRLIKYHDERPTLEPIEIRRFVAEVGCETMLNLLAVKRADVLAQSDYMRAEKLDYIADIERQYQVILDEKQCVCIADLAIDGRDLLTIGVPQGKQIGQILNALLDMVLEEPKWNNHEKLMELAKKYV